MRRYDEDLFLDEDGEFVQFDDHVAALAARDQQWEQAYRDAFGKRQHGEPEWMVERRVELGLAALRKRVQREEQS